MVRQRLEGGGAGVFTHLRERQHLWWGVFAASVYVKRLERIGANVLMYRRGKTASVVGSVCGECLRQRLERAGAGVPTFGFYTIL